MRVQGVKSMGLDIGAAVIAETKKEKKREIKKLVVLKEDDETSIYNLIFTEAQKETE
jgi:hypothetical protein